MNIYLSEVGIPMTCYNVSCIQLPIVSVDIYVLLQIDHGKTSLIIGVTLTSCILVLIAIVFLTCAWRIREKKKKE